MKGQRAAERSRHIVFALVWAAVVISLVWSIPTRMPPSPPAQMLYDAIEKCPQDKLIVLSTSWDVGTRGENGPQTAALIHHLFRSNRKFAIFGWVHPPGPMLAEQIARRLARHYHKRYGVDWVNWGYKTGMVPMIQGLAKDVPAIIREDLYHTPIHRIPVMRNVRDHRDIAMVIDITGSATLDTWIMYWQGVYGTRIGYACTGVMVPEAFPRLDAGQIKGVLKGLVGAAEYETLVGVAGDGQQRMTAQSLVHLLIIGLILLGNFLALRAGRKG